MSPTFEDHLRDLSEVLDRLIQHNLKLKLSKCEFHKAQVLYLGLTRHIISRQGIHPNPALVNDVLNAARPKNVSELRPLWGLCGYYRKFIRNYSSISRPLTSLLRKDIRYIWTDDCEAAFQIFKSCLCSAPVLAFPDFKLNFVVQTNASATGLGAVLPQEFDGREHPIAYASRSLTKAERRYSTIDR